MSERAGGDGIYWRAADGTGHVERLHPGTVVGYYGRSWSADGRSLVMNALRGTSLWDIGSLSMDGSQAVAWLLESGDSEVHPDVSPDGHWMAYCIDESGQWEVFVSPEAADDQGGDGDRPGFRPRLMVVVQGWSEELKRLVPLA